MFNRKGYSLIELLIVSCIGLLILGAAYMLYTGSLKLFKDVKTTADNIQTKMPSMELVGRYFDRWGVGVVATGADCSAYPPSNARCITVTAGTDFDQVTFWGSVYGTGTVKGVASGLANVFSCRLNNSSANHQNCYYVWRNNTIQNQISGSVVVPLALNANLSQNDADCSAVTATSILPTVSATMTPVVTGTNLTLASGDFINRAPHLIRLYCATNANDGGRYWLYADLTDTATQSSCSLNQAAVPIAPVNRFKVQLEPTGCTAASGACTTARVTATFRSQSKNYKGDYGTYAAERVFGR